MEPQKKIHRRNNPNFRVLLDYFMALLMVFFGVFVIFSEKIIGYDYFADSKFVSGSMKWIVGILFMLYGVFRAYRGYLSAQNEKHNSSE
jgi:hypothetical protein